LGMFGLMAGVVTREPLMKGRLGTIDLLVLTGLDQPLLTMWA
jgi:hypothetical protein